MFCLWEVWLCFYYIYALLLRHFILLFDFCNLFKKIASEDAALTLWQKMMSDEQVMTFPPFLTRRKYKSAKYLQNQSNFLFIYGKLEWLWPAKLVLIKLLQSISRHILCFCYLSFFRCFSHWIKAKYQTANETPCSPFFFKVTTKKFSVEIQWLVIGF